MRDALAKGNTLHRDISVSNIILVREPGQARRKGYLIDWDSCCDVDEAGRALVAGRAVRLSMSYGPVLSSSDLSPLQGTWQFLSVWALSLQGLTNKQTLADDLESLLYVVVYCALLWIPHELSPRDLGSAISYIFDYSMCASDKARAGGEGKVGLGIRRAYTEAAEFSPPLEKWLHTVIYNIIDLGWTGCRPRGFSPWAADELDAFWADFLQTERLESNDRVDHDLLGALIAYETPLGFHSTEAIVLGKRRAAMEHESETLQHEKKSKRRKVSRLVADNAGALPRRSARIAAKQPHPPKACPKHTSKRRSTRSKASGRQDGRLT